jgi:hypothetical protein
VVVQLPDPVPAVPAAVTNVPAPATNEVAATEKAVEPEPVPVVTEPPKPRVVTREGWVSRMTSIQAPSYYKLENLQTRRIMDYLVSPSTNLVLSRYVGRHVIVTGEEVLDQRWPTTPVITIQRIQVVEE